MTEAGIVRGDIVVVDQSIPARHGNIVLVVMDGECRIHHLFKRGGQYRLFLMAIGKRNCLKVRMCPFQAS